MRIASSAYRAVAGAMQRQVSPAARAGVKQAQGITLSLHPAEQRDGFQRLQGAHHPYHGARNARRATVALWLGIIWPQTAIATLCPGRRQNHHLPAKPDRTGGNQWRILRDTGGVDGLSRCHIVSAIQHHVGKRDFTLQVFATQSRLSCYQFNIWI